MEKSKDEIDRICAGIRRKAALETARAQLRWGYVGLAFMAVLLVVSLACGQWRWWWLCFFLSPLMAVVNGYRIRRGGKPW